MTLTYTKYTLTDGTVIKITSSDGWDIPPSTDNTMYTKYLKWVEEGNTPTVVVVGDDE